MKLITTKFDLVEADAVNWIDREAVALVITKSDIAKDRNFFENIRFNHGILLTNPINTDDLESRLMGALQKLCNQLQQGADSLDGVQP